MAKLNIEIEQLNTQINEGEAKITSTESEIENTKLLLEQTESEIADKEEILDKRVRNIQKSGLTSNILLYIVNSESVSDLFDRFEAVKKIITLDKDLIAEVKEKKELIAQSMDELNVKQDELVALQAESEKSLQDIESKKAEQEVKVAQLNDQQEAAFAVIEANEEKLIAYSVSVIDTSSSISELQNAVSTLTALIPQLNSDNVIYTANINITAGNTKIAELQAEQAAAETPTVTPSRGDTSSNDGTIADSSGSTALSTFTMQATAYTGGTFTATGTTPVYNPSGISTVAVDPSVIPLGSKVYVSGYGTAIAADTGGAINGNIIDVYFNSEADCIAWGRRTVTVEILALPGQW